MFKRITTGLCLCAAVTAGAQTIQKPAAPATKPTPHASTKTTVHASTHDSQAALRKEATITMVQARATALKEVPNGRVGSAELERENGKLVYSFDIKVPGKSGVDEVLIDAISGAVVSNKHETPQTEAKEAKAEKAEMKKR